MLDTVRLALGRSAPSPTLYECRDCGSSVPAEDIPCPVCESTEVATYEL